MVCVIVSLCYLATWHSFKMKPVMGMEKAVLFNQSWQATVLKDQGLSSTFRQALSLSSR